MHQLLVAYFPVGISAILVRMYAVCVEGSVQWRSVE